MPMNHSSSAKPKPSFSAPDLERARVLLCQLGDAIRQTVVAARDGGLADSFAGVAGETAADTIYQVDKLSEEAIFGWFEAHWPKEWPVELVMEGLESDEATVFPRGVPLNQVVFTCILDPIDGTRALMYDKRSAWALAALAPRRGQTPSLTDITVAAMTELPTSKQTITDQISAVAGCGRDGIVAERRDPLHQSSRQFRITPSGATDFRHGFATLCKFFPEGKTLTAQIETELWDQLYPLGSTASPLIFDDEYISSGGQIYEILVGHDRMVADLRPLILPKAGFHSSLACHPYDICTGLLLVEAGCIFEGANGQPVEAPLDTTTPVSWIGYANSTLADLARPVLQRALRKHLKLGDEPL